MNESNDKFKWLWISGKILYDENLNLIEACVFSAINSLDKSDEHCWASNNYLAKAFKCSVRTIIRAIGHLKELGYIEELDEGKEGVCRKLRAKINIESNPGQIVMGGGDTRDKLSPPPGHSVTPPVTNCHPPRDKLSPYIYIDNIIDNIIDNNIGAQKNFCSPDALRASTDTADAETGLSVDSGKKSKRKSQKQKRYEEVMASPEFTATLCHGIESEEAKQELISLWGEYVELRCSKDYKAFTDGAVKRNLKVLDGTSLEERKEIISKSVAKGRTGLFPLNDYDKKRLVTKEANVEGSDERLYNSILKMNCQEREELIPQGTLHKYLMDLVEQYGEDKIKDIYYNRVRPEIKSIYGIKRDWVSH